MLVFLLVSEFSWTVDRGMSIGIVWRGTVAEVYANRRRGLLLWDGDEDSL